jgi:hypothetical protein
VQAPGIRGGGEGQHDHPAQTPCSHTRTPSDSEPFLATTPHARPRSQQLPSPPAPVHAPTDYVNKMLRHSAALELPRNVDEAEIPAFMAPASTCEFMANVACDPRHCGDAEGGDGAGVGFHGLCVLVRSPLFPSLRTLPPSTTHEKELCFHLTYTFA